MKRNHLEPIHLTHDGTCTDKFITSFVIMTLRVHWGGIDCRFVPLNTVSMYAGDEFYILMWRITSKLIWLHWRVVIKKILHQL